MTALPATCEEHMLELLTVENLVATASRLCLNEIRHRARLALEIVSDTPDVYGDESQLVQVLVNLVNAAHAVGDEGEHRIRVRSGRCELGAFIEVQDDGEGMSQAVHRRIVWITGGAFTEEARALIETTAQPVVEKPIEPAALRATIASLLARD